MQLFFPGGHFMHFNKWHSFCPIIISLECVFSGCDCYVSSRVTMVATVFSMRRHLTQIKTDYGQSIGIRLNKEFLHRNGHMAIDHIHFVVRFRNAIGRISRNFLFIYKNYSCLTFISDWFFLCRYGMASIWIQILTVFVKSMRSTQYTCVDYLFAWICTQIFSFLFKL